MILFIKVLFYLSAFVIFWAMIGYTLSLSLLNKIYKNKRNDKDYSNIPTVTIMIVAHNEEKVILDKLKNVVDLDYPQKKIKYIIASDNSTDNTNLIVENFINKNKIKNMSLYKVIERKGKTNAQNEAQKQVDTEFLIMTDANSIMHEQSVKELMSSFTSENIAYVSGKLSILKSDSDISKAESSYWDSDLKIREIESKIQSITAGNGALYAVRTKDYYDFDPIKSHDSAMPLHYSLQSKRAICNHDAIAYEKAGQTIEDEFGRKVRMNRRILEKILPSFKLLNIFKYKWFSYFYFGHRTCRYLLWIMHLILLLSNLILVTGHLFYLIIFIGQISFYFIALSKLLLNINNKYINIIYYYCVTMFAQWIGVYNILTGKTKPFWEKAETTR